MRQLAEKTGERNNTNETTCRGPLQVSPDDLAHAPVLNGGKGAY